MFDVTIPQNPVELYLLSLAKSGRRSMRQALQKVSVILSGSSDISSYPWHKLNRRQIEKVREIVAERYAPATANKIIAAVRGVLKTAWQMGLMDGDDYFRAVDIKPIRNERPPAGRYVTKEELGAILATCDDGTPIGTRDAAIITLLYACGLRRTELVKLTIDNYDKANARVFVHGKGNKWRVLPLPSSVVEILDAWLAVRGDETGPLFCSIRKGGHLTGQGMTAEAVYDMVKLRAKLAGVPTLSLLDLRRTFVSDLLDAGVDIAIVQQLAGHANMVTTSRYDRRPEAAKRKAVSLLHFPYTPRR